MLKALWHQGLCANRDVIHTARAGFQPDCFFPAVVRLAPHMEESSAAPEELLNRDVRIVGDSLGFVRLPRYNGCEGLAYAFDADEGGVLHARGRKRERERLLSQLPLPLALYGLQAATPC